MEGERIEGLSIFFTAGAALSACLHGVSPSASAADSFAGAVLASAAFFIMYIRHRNGIAAIFTLWFMAGYCCYAMAFIGEAWKTEEIGRAVAAARTAAAKVKASIYEIPFSDGDTAGLVSALITGDRSGIGRETQEIFRKSGASHILALSGLHLGVIYTILQKAASMVGNSPAAAKARSIAIIFFSGFYSIATGASPSIIRAFLFISLSETARMLNRRRNASTVLFSALFIQLALNPPVIKSAGFQLSYLAMCGITCIYPKMEAWYPCGDGGRTDVVRKMWNAAALGISCQAFTAPAVWFYFKSFPPFFLMTNLLAMPVTTLLIFLSAASSALACFGIYPSPLVHANEKTAGILMEILTVISGM